MRWLVNIVSSRVGIAVSCATLVAFSVSSAQHFISQFDEVRNEGTLFDGYNMREGFFALSDLQRLNVAVLEAANAGAVTEHLAGHLSEAADFLYVRASAIERKVVPYTPSVPLRNAVAQIHRVIGAVDTAREQGYADPAALLSELTGLSGAVRRDLILFLDETRNQQVAMVERQQNRLSRQIVQLLVFLFCMTLISGAVLFLLRREVLLRKSVQRAEKRAHYLAFYDALTGLPNRVLFYDRVEAHLESGAPATLAFVDLDNFKAINDTSGHAVGDAVLRSVARQFCAAVSPRGGMAARLSGDEFALFLPTADIAEFTAIGERLIRNCAEPILFENEKIATGISMGVVSTEIAREVMPVTPAAMSRLADFALYASKSAGRGRLTVFDAALEIRYRERQKMLTELPQAIANREIAVFLQPKVQLSTGEVYGFEALARWIRNGVVVAPEEFIELAESSGAVIRLDTYVLREAAAEVSAWNRQTGAGFSVSVNLSALHFRKSGIVTEIAHVLAETGLAPEDLTLEITETVQLMDWQQVRAILRQIRALGCRISIDDFGAGYSSLAYLRAMEADEVKIDRSLIAEIGTSDEARFIFDCVVDLAAALRFDLVVEGVEDAGQVRALRRAGCEKAQGFLYGQPVAAEEALAATAHRRLAV